MVIAQRRNGELARRDISADSNIAAVRILHEVSALISRNMVVVYKS